MKLECLPNLGEKGVFTLYCDDDPWKDIHAAIFGNTPEIPIHADHLDQLEGLFAELEYKQAKKYAFKRLTAKNYSSFELTKNLQQHLISPSTIDKIIRECQQLGYINDQDWLQNFIRQHTHRHHGPKLIAMKLKAKGVPEESIQEALDGATETSQQAEQIQKLLQSRSKFRDLNHPKDKQKAIGFLLRRGYSMDVIYQSLKSLHA